MMISGKRVCLVLAAAVLAGAVPVLAPATAHAASPDDGPRKLSPTSNSTKAVGTADNATNAKIHKIVTLSYPATAGGKHEMRAVLNVDSVTERTRVSVILACDGSSLTDPEGGDQYVKSGQNVLAGATNTITARFVYTVPSSGAVNCSFWIRLSTLSGHAGQTVRVLNTSYIESHYGKLRWATDNAFVGGKVQLSAGERQDFAINSFGVTTRSRITVVGDVNLTNCYTGATCPSGLSRGTPTKATSQLIIVQLTNGGGTCKVSSDAAVTTTVTGDVHHLKAYHWVPVTAEPEASGSSGCSRNYRAYIRVTYVSGNPVEIAPAHQSYTYAYVVETA